MASTRISPYKTSKIVSNKGFSFLEVMIVLIIVGLFVTMGPVKFLTPDREMKAEVRKFGALVRKLRSRARIENRTFRLVFDLPGDKKTEQSYWVESTEQAALLMNTEEREERTQSEEDDNGEEKIVDPQGFAVNSDIVANPPGTLARNLYFESIELSGEKNERFNIGRIFIYFFPQGYVQGSAIHLTNRDKLNWTLVIHPLTGAVDIFDRDVPLEEATDQ
ncbi:MAG: prepilin-type N-terminal cleavage/methylation domain-containing protein [Bdellovibrionales bacterium]|nr:prepilin-type N-terminal cleavage/methylation domain-containing protein [Bdellovibrionales bacterium]